jgi:acetyl-CoA synthetase
VLGTVGEPINPEAWEWYHNVVGKGTSVPHYRHLVADRDRRPPDDPPARRARHEAGSAAMKPFFGMKCELVDSKDGKTRRATPEGNLCASPGLWPGQMRTRLWRP